MNRPTRRLLAAAMAMSLVLTAAACSSGDDEDSADATTTTTATAPGEPCDEVYVAGDGQPQGPDAVEARGEPEMSACDPGDADLLIVDEIVGTGAEVPEGATVTVHYSGVDATTGTVFDSSWSRGETISFPLDGVIQGWGEGLVGMKEGGRRTLVIPPELAYGDSGPAPGDYLIFTVDLVSVEAPASTVPGSAGADSSSTTVAG
jgi:hypothetical protein